MNSITARLILQFLVANALLLPAISVTVFVVFERGEKSMFIDHVRASGRLLADVLEYSLSEDAGGDATALLDRALLSGTGVYAQLSHGDKVYTSVLSDSLDDQPFVEDFGFNEHGDDVYFLSLPLDLADGQGVLRVGYDETATKEQIVLARWRGFQILVVYLVIMLVLVVMLSTRFTRPVRRLQEDARRIASGDYDAHLHATGRLREISDLARDLDFMRDKLVASNTRLREEIAERQTAETQNKALEQSLRHAQRLESVGTLAGGVAHEFNNILQPLTLYAELALEDVPHDSSARGPLQRVMGLVERARDIVAQILTFSRGGQGVERDAMALAPIVEEAMTLMRALVPATVELEVGIDPDCGEVFCDPTQMQQLIVNLCNNACQSMARHQGKVRVTLESFVVDRQHAREHPRLSPGEYALLQVSDDGEGMDGATMARIFEPFYTARQVGEGTGLGLSVVHGIVVAHDGDITVHSRVGEGSTFRVWLPTVDAAAVHDPAGANCINEGVGDSRPIEQ